MSDETQRLETVVLRIIQTGRDRCGAGFGKYPLGIYDAIEELIPLLPESILVREKLRDFKARLDR